MIEQKIKDVLRKYPRLYGLFSYFKYLPGRIVRRLVPYRLRSYCNWLGFYGDPFLKYLVFNLSKQFNITSCVETGSYKGDTTLFLAKVFPDIFRYSIELSDEYYRESRWRVRSFLKSLIIKGSSPESIKKLIDDSKLGDLPLFFLDAHWNEYWPLLDELKQVSKLGRAIIIIHDFQVDGRPEYGYDSYKVKDKNIPNNFDYISTAMSAKNYRFLLPKYKAEEVWPEDPKGIRGYVVIFQNFMEEDWDMIKNSKLVTDHYECGKLSADEKFNAMQKLSVS